MTLLLCALEVASSILAKSAPFPLVERLSDSSPRLSRIARDATDSTRRTTAMKQLIEQVRRERLGAGMAKLRWKC
jgi:hypothetical protein